MAELVNNDVYKRTLANEKCKGCKWLIEFGTHKDKLSCLNSRLCINYNEWEENYEDKMLVL